jgi:hypothetical protein
MAEGDATLLTSGQDNGSGADDALFLKRFSGEVLAAFDEVNMSMDKHNVRNIDSGKSAQFPATWKATASLEGHRFLPHRWCGTGRPGHQPL